MKILRVLLTVLCFGVWIILPAIAIDALPNEAAQVSVYGEGYIRQGKLNVFLFLDTGEAGLMSYGVRLGYDPSQLTFESAVKSKEAVSNSHTGNTAKWIIGNPDSPFRYLPDAAHKTGEIRLIGGRFDPDDPQAGITPGQKIFLGMAKFRPAPGQSDESLQTAGLSINFGRNHSNYNNFVRINAGNIERLDDGSVAFGTIEIFSPANPPQTPVSPIILLLLSE